MRLKSLLLRQKILAVSFAPDGTTIATSGADQKVHTWGTSKGDAHDVFDPNGQPSTAALQTRRHTCHPRRRWRSVFGTSAQSGKWLKSSGLLLEILYRPCDCPRSHRTVKLPQEPGDPSRSPSLELSRRQASSRLAGIHSDSVLDIDFSPDGAHIATAAADKFVKVTDAIKGSVVRTFEGHTHHVMGISSLFGREILSSGADKDLKYWNFENGDRLGKGGGFHKEVTTVHFIGAGTEAIATSAEGKISVVRSGSNISQANSFQTSPNTSTPQM